MPSAMSTHSGNWPHFHSINKREHSHEIKEFRAVRWMSLSPPYCFIEMDCGILLQGEGLDALWDSLQGLALQAAIRIDRI